MSTVIEKIRYRIKPISLTGCYQTLSRDHLRLGIYDYFIKGNMQSFKQHLHVAGKLELASIALESFQKMETPSDIHYALLSDSPDLINSFARIEPPYFMSACHNPLTNYFKTHMWQLALRGDDAALQAKIDKLAKNGRKADRVAAAKGEDFFSLLIRGNQAELEAFLLSGARKQTGDPLMEDFVAETSTYRAKLCWYRGIPVQLDHPLIPMELMPIQPLEHYDDVYDFLAPDWQPPHQTFFEKIGRWYRTRKK